ncbi:phosphoglycerate mutase [Paracoccus aminophilus JCM 7686]|uniref:Phosphoglycerate mutase n=2 Tax=Paracoccus aminophilus TaxID=34003 RepID=S5Y151_PARAH|nr:phosphoglycerate mutase [Paracoccus aminophilus JCM 7686]
MKLCLLRHAPLPPGSGLAGRRDLAAVLPLAPELAALQARLQALAPTRIWSSPALRCRQTCAALGLEAETDPRLWEQDFGAWEQPGTAIPDLGPLPLEELARHRPPGGESFADLVARTRPALEAMTGTALIIAHAGTVRAALSLVIGPAALSFAVAPLSLTVIEGSPGQWSVSFVNWTAPELVPHPQTS